ncbi:hypothetical protein H476_0284 [[Clostridium] sordellii VPI 9048]|nr:hypothetical protein H476_0284 [[Clostridium] sordellii VPI 9048] [Paeniclostridium sordellii VPI 9048]
MLFYLLKYMKKFLGGNKMNDFCIMCGKRLNENGDLICINCKEKL